MATRIEIRRDTAANWALANPVLALGEPGYDSTTNKLKIGDGATKWANLPFVLKGDPGPQGPSGTGVKILGQVSDPADLPATGEPGDAYLVLTHLYIWDSLNGVWVDAGSFQGLPGAAASIEAGTVSYGDTLSVNNSGTSAAAVFNFVLPRPVQAASYHSGFLLGGM